MRCMRRVNSNHFVTHISMRFGLFFILTANALKYYSFQLCTNNNCTLFRRDSLYRLF